MNRFYKRQTKWTWVPAAINVMASSSEVCIQIHAGFSADPDHPCEDCKEPRMADIVLTEQEAMALASWLHTQAERIIDRKRKAAARRAKAKEARIAKKGGQ